MMSKIIFIGGDYVGQVIQAIRKFNWSKFLKVYKAGTRFCFFIYISFLQFLAALGLILLGYLVYLNQYPNLSDYKKWLQAFDKVLPTFLLIIALVGLLHYCLKAIIKEQKFQLQCLIHMNLSYWRLMGVGFLIGIFIKLFLMRF